jgi:hypothetical protein|tara:strand:+ start:13 stop:354 length:342 start_codon:yes stop_codon:yes gene_type:complete
MSDEWETTKYFDRDGCQVDSADDAMSKVDCRPNDFRFFKKVMRWKLSFRRWRISLERCAAWEFHHHSTMFGSWMWPEGKPMRFDASGKVIDRTQECTDHALRINSTWRPGIDR